MEKPIININARDAVIRDTPGHWRYVIDDEEEHQEVFTDKSHPPDFTPAGRWEWQPSAMEAYRAAGWGMTRFPSGDITSSDYKQTPTKLAQPHDIGEGEMEAFPSKP